MKSCLASLMLALLALLTACEGGAAVFAPTPLPPDVSPLRYDHPSGAFSITVPRTWSIYEQYTTTLASATFYAPGSLDPALVAAAVNLGTAPDSAALSALLTRFQTEIRADAARYKEESRSAMGDGSWRMGGLRQTAGSITQQVNTFLQLEGTVFGFVEVVLSTDNARNNALQAALNTFILQTDTTLEAADADTLARVSSGGLEIANVSTWQTAAGVFYITGEIANMGTTTVMAVPVRAELRTADELPIVEALDTAMGYGISPGGFAPFSLRFGGGQPSLSAGYILQIGNAQWQPDAAAQIIGGESLEWTDESQFTADGTLVITGTVTNTGSRLVRGLRVVVTVFDDAQRVTAAAFTDARPAEIAPDETAAFEFLITEYGAAPANYIINVQGQP